MKFIDGEDGAPSTIEIEMSESDQLGEDETTYMEVAIILDELDLEKYIEFEIFAPPKLEPLPESETPTNSTDTIEPEETEPEVPLTEEEKENEVKRIWI